MSRCRIFEGKNGERFYSEAVMHLSYDEIIIALDFTHSQTACNFFHSNYGYVAIKNDVISVADITDAFNKLDDEYSNRNNRHVNNLDIIIRFSHDGIRLVMHNTKNNEPPMSFNVIQCNKQRYNDCFIESLKQAN